jgi:hypothetical protein
MIMVSSWLRETLYWEEAATFLALHFCRDWGGDPDSGVRKKSCELYYAKLLFCLLLGIKQLRCKLLKASRGR